MQAVVKHTQLFLATQSSMSLAQFSMANHARLLDHAHMHMDSLAAVLANTARVALASTDIDARVGGCSLLGRRVDDAFLDIRSEGEEGLFDVDVALCADFHKRDTEFVGEGLALGGGDGPFLFPVALVAYEDLVHAFGCVLFDVGKPCSDV